jgi:hypothetical protein
MTTGVRGLINTSSSDSCGEMNRAVGLGPLVDGFLAFFVESDPFKIEGGGIVCFGVVPCLLALDR